MLVEKSLAALLACHFGVVGQILLFNLLQKSLTSVRFLDKSMFLNSTHCFISTLSQWSLVNLGVQVLGVSIKYRTFARDLIGSHVGVHVVGMIL